MTFPADSITDEAIRSMRDKAMHADPPDLRTANRCTCALESDPQIIVHDADGRWTREDARRWCMDRLLRAGDRKRP